MFWYDHRALSKMKKCFHCEISYENIKPKKKYANKKSKIQKTRIEMIEGI